MTSSKPVRCYICVYLFAKKDRKNISDAELASFREIADSYDKLTDQQIAQLLTNRDLTEICRGH